MLLILMLIVVWTDLTRSALSTHEVQHYSHGHQAGEYSDVLYGGSCASNCSRGCRVAEAWH